MKKALVKAIEFAQDQPSDTVLHEWSEQVSLTGFEAEIWAYAKLHPKLVEEYLGQFVVIHNGRIIDHDKDFETLFLRTQKQLEGTPFLIQLVTESGEMTLRGPSPRLEWK